MPETRSASGKRTLGQLMFGNAEQTTSSEETATASESKDDSTSPQETSRSTTNPATPSRQETPQSSLHPAAPPPSRSIKTTSSRRARRLAQAREEVLKIKLELAQARIAAIENEDTDNEDIETVMSTALPERRIDEWLESNSRHVLAITDMPHREEEPEPITPQYIPSTQAKHIAEDTGPDATAARPGHPVPPPGAAAGTGARAPLSAAAPLFTPAPPTPPPRNEQASIPPPWNMYSQENVREDNVIATKSQKIDLADLASAIAVAARAGHRESSRYRTELPQYNGSHQEWLSFKAAYDETASAYTDVENIARLRRCLKGIAKEAVENLLIYNARADEIMKSLETRFGRPDTIALAELERLRAMSRLNDGPRDICVFASRVANTVATLKALNRAHYLYSPETTRAMMEKLTPALRYRWFDYAITQNSEEPELLKLSTFLQREADYCALYAQPENIDATNTRPAKKTHKAFATTEKPASKCPCCNDDGHNIFKCSKFIDKPPEDRWKIAKEQRLCFRCLRYRTGTHSCKRVKCEQDGCEYFHNKLLHYTKKEEKTEAVASTWATRDSKAYLKIIPVTISGPAGEVNTHALLDDGSTITLVHEDIAREAGLDGPIEPLLIEAITIEKIDASQSRRVTLNIRGTEQRHDIRARTIDDLRLSPQSIKREDLHNCPHLRDIEDYLRYDAAKPKVLIGQDNWHLLVSSETRRGQRHQPVASLTPLGWVLHGAHTRIIGKQVHATHHVTTQEKQEKDDNMNVQLGKYFALESLLIEPKLPQSSPDERARNILEQSTSTTVDGHYEAPLLWKDVNSRLPDNYENTLRRLHNIEKKLDKDEKLKKRYNEEMDALLHKGYAEPAPPTKSKKVWYLPHFAVLNPMKPDKVRIVHDAAATTRGVSLNDRLLTGPDLLQSLPGVLMRFRQHAIAVGADIKEMFMQVKVKSEDRDALRYLWRGDRRDNNAPQEYRMTSLIFGATCSPSIAIYVKNTNAQKHQETHPDAVQAIVRNHYVDDYLQSFASQAEAIRVASAVRDIHKEAHYELRQWTSNSTEVLEALTEDIVLRTVDLLINVNAEYYNGTPSGGEWSF